MTMRPFALPLIIVAGTEDTPWEDDEDIGAVVTVIGTDIQIPIYGYIDHWGDGGQSPEDVVADIMGTLVTMAVERINDRDRPGSAGA